MRAATVSRLRTALLGWYDGNARDLPWRSTGDPYAVWVSEVMLQQTQVATVIPYYLRFMERFPTLADLAAAQEDEVLAAWAGLGYYTRARRLLAGAKEVRERHGGRVPQDRAGLTGLPGIGRYTAGAIASIAFGRREPVLDGNVRRVLSRLTGGRLRGDRTAVDESACWELAGALVNGPRPGDLNQAVMELGAIVCTPSSPECGTCPVRDGCLGHRSGNPERYPAPAGRPAVEQVLAAVVVVRRGGRILLEKPGLRSPLRGTWDLPAVECDAGENGADVLVRALRRDHGLEIRPGPEEAVVSHGIMNRRIRLAIHRTGSIRGRVAGREKLRWIDPAGMDRVPVSGATLKVLRAARS